MANTGQTSRIQTHSPLAVVGSFLYLIREHFASQLQTWVWRDNRTATDVLIEVAYERGAEAADAKPGIYVDRTQTVYMEVAIGRQDQMQPGVLEKRIRHRYSIGQTDMQIECVSPRRGESTQLGAFVQQYLHMSNEIICGAFTYRNMSPVLLGPTQPYEKDEQMFSTNVSFRVEHELRWASIPNASTLKAITALLNVKDVEQRLVDTYLGQ